MRKLLFTFILVCLSVSALAQTYSFSGLILDEGNNPVEFATVVLESTSQWAVTDEHGAFTIKNVQPGKNVVKISCLGYVSDIKEIIVSKDIDRYMIALKEDNLTLESATITAQENKNSATTSRTIDRTALDHIQMVNVFDVTSLLPGGSTKSPDLLAAQTFNIRGGGNEMGNASFGTAVEVDGVRLSNNSTFAYSASSGVSGTAVNNVASTNVESIEVITGVPSVEYGDMTSGVVKINTNRGRTPYMATFTTNPNLKQFSISKGFGLGRSASGASRGVLNGSLEYSKATSDPRSPYTSYDRKQVGITYSNTFDHGAFRNSPLRMSVGATGNLGGLDTKADPDSFGENRTIGKDDSYRANFSFDWLLSKSWITNIELTGAVVYSDKHTYEKKNYSLAVATAVAHGREEGYFVATEYDKDPNAAILLREPGYHYQIMCTDDKPLTYKLGLKANWTRQFGAATNKVKAGFEWAGDGNLGIGQYTEDMRTAPDFWEYPYNELPFMNSYSFYLEDNLSFPIGGTRLTIIPGIRNDNRVINGSEYGRASSFSPRLNTKWNVLSPRNRRRKALSELSFRASLGMASKLPSFSILYPEPTYNVIAAFRPASNSSGTAYNAYYIMPRTVEYNPDLKWQKNMQSEIGVDLTLFGTKISLAGYYNKTYNTYRISRDYDRFTYMYTTGDDVDKAAAGIANDDRIYSVDRNTGVVTVKDRTGVVDDIIVPGRTRKMFSTRTYSSNSVAPVTRYGVEWVIDFKRIAPLNTTIRMDGTYYGYRGVDLNLEPYTSPGLLGHDSDHYKYVAYYYGGDNISNGSETATIKNNITITTHIPKVRMITSLRIEGTLMRYSRALSELPDGSERAKVAAGQNNLIDVGAGSIYDGKSFSFMYPEYYKTFDDPVTERNFAEDFRNADKTSPLYVDLSKMVTAQMRYTYTFKKNYLTPYFSMNFRVTKEIGDIASLSFYANNFFISNMMVKSSMTGQKSSASSYVTGYYYGLSLKLKF